MKSFATKEAKRHLSILGKSIYTGIPRKEMSEYTYQSLQFCQSKCILVILSTPWYQRDMPLLPRWHRLLPPPPPQNFLLPISAGALDPRLSLSSPSPPHHLGRDSWLGSEAKALDRSLSLKVGVAVAPFLLSGRDWMKEGKPCGYWSRRPSSPEPAVVVGWGRGGGSGGGSTFSSLTIDTKPPSKWGHVVTGSEPPPILLHEMQLSDGKAKDHCAAQPHVGGLCFGGQPTPNARRDSGDSQNPPNDEDTAFRQISDLSLATWGKRWAVFAGVGSVAERGGGGGGGEGEGEGKSGKFPIVWRV